MSHLQVDYFLSKVKYTISNAAVVVVVTYEIIIIIIIIFINCNWVVTRWQWLFYMYTNMR